ncbi:MAG: dehydrogenase, partial [Candidatus Niyogibacteria bacterium]|nr:dehydrogenase [Candidatus Niyogibacteria bacterium]
MKCEITYAKAITETHHEEMEKFPELFTLGQDICRPEGAEGAFKITTGLPKRFPDRVIGTILNESSIVGNGIGIALRGGKAICEMQFADFATEALKMILNYAAPLHYRHGLKLSLVIRMPSGIIGSAGAYHSVSPEATFFGEPGLI